MIRVKCAKSLFLFKRFCIRQGNGHKETLLGHLGCLPAGNSLQHGGTESTEVFAAESLILAMSAAIDVNGEVGGYGG